MKPSPVAGVFACLVILGCASTGVYVPVQRPAAIRFDRFAAVAVSGTDDRADAGERTDTLAARDFTERLQDRLAELVPRETTIFRTAFPPAENGQLLAVLFSYARREGVDGLLVASILRMSYHEAVESAVVDDPSLGKTARLARKGVLSGMVVVNMYDIAEQACLRSDTHRTEQRAESRSFGVDPSAIDRGELRTRALQALVDEAPPPEVMDQIEAAIVLGALLHRALYDIGFSKAQESAQRFARGAVLRRFPYWVLRPFGNLRRELVLKEVRLFFRDTTQWSQLILLAVLVVGLLLDYLLPLGVLAALPRILRLVVGLLLFLFGGCFVAWYARKEARAHPRLFSASLKELAKDRERLTAR